jgi:hypothetical protein
MVIIRFIWLILETQFYGEFITFDAQNKGKQFYRLWIYCLLRVEIQVSEMKNIFFLITLLRYCILYVNLSIFFQSAYSLIQFPLVRSVMVL